MPDYSKMQTYRHDNINITIGAVHQIKEWTVGVDVEDGARKQSINVANLPFIYKHVALMPDTHSGIGATVGSVIPTIKAIIPAAAGVDLGCVDADTEFLTLHGWKRISDYTEGDSVLVSDNVGNAHFDQPKEFIKLPCTEFWHIKTKYGVNQVLSDEHRILYYQHTRDYKFENPLVMTADVLAKKHNSLKLGFRGRFLTSFFLTRDTSVSYSNEIIRVMVMICADGHYPHKTNNYCILSFKKERKILRARKLLTDASIAFNESANSEGIVSITFTAPHKFKCLSVFWDASPEQLGVICEEVFNWDGNIDESCYYSRNKESADFMSYAFAACGKRSVMRSDEHYRDGKTDYRVFAQPNIKVGIAASPEKENFTRIPSIDGLKYCFKVSTGFWVMRRGGVIAITGNCGVLAQKTTLKKSHLGDLAKIRFAMEDEVPHGRTDGGGENDKGAWKDIPPEVQIAWMELESGYKEITTKHPKISHKQCEHQLGTLGSGNHFLSLSYDENDEIWLMLHSGSRGIGNRIGSYFIDAAKRDMEKYFINLDDPNCAYIPEGTDLFDDYTSAVLWAQRFAKVNRSLMLHFALKGLKKSGQVPKFEIIDNSFIDCHHNYIEKEYHFGKTIWVTRKGAVRARKNDMVIIPGAMASKSYIGIGLGNEDSFMSCSHGAGRKMSRTEAKNTFSVKDHIEATKLAECRKDSSVIDETPAAYKNIDLVMAAQKDLVSPVHTLQEIVCIKG